MSHHFFVMWSKLLTPTQKRQMAPSLWLSSRQCYLTCRRVWPKANQRRSEKKTFMHNKTKFGSYYYVNIQKKRLHIRGWFLGERVRRSSYKRRTLEPHQPPLNVWRVHCRYIVRRYFYDAEWKMIWIIWKNFCIECADIGGSKNSE